MRSRRGGLVTVLAAGALLVLPMSNTRVTRMVSRVGASSTDPKVLYGAHEKEYWLSTDEFDYVRPGFVITVNSITFDAGLHAVVDLTYTDGLGVPLDRAGVLTPGAISMSFVLAWWDSNARQYTSYTFKSVTSSITGMTATQAAADSGGTFQDIDIGHSIYTFKTKLPAGYDATATTTLGIYATRDTTAVLGKPYYANVEQDFVPERIAGDARRGTFFPTRRATRATTRCRRTAGRARTSSSASCAISRRRPTRTRATRWISR